MLRIDSSRLSYHSNYIYMDDDSKTKLSVITTDITVAVVILLLAVAILGVYLNQILAWYQQLLEWFYAILDRFIWLLFIIFGMLDIMLIGFMIFTLRRFSRLQKRPLTAETPIHIVSPKEEVRESWEHIRDLANSSNPSDWNMAVLRADAILDDILQHLGYEGTTLAERLKIVDSSKLPSIERIWSAHRLRNMIAHDPMEQHTRETIVHALRSYEEALKELGMMEEAPS